MPEPLVELSKCSDMREALPGQNKTPSESLTLNPMDQLQFEAAQLRISLLETQALLKTAELKLWLKELGVAQGLLGDFTVKL